MARERNCMMEYPKKTPKKARSIEYKTILVLQDEQKTALRKRPAKGLLAGMYEFPWMEGIQNEDSVLEYVKSIGIQAIHIKRLEDSKHIFSHKEWHMTGYAIRVDELERSGDKSGLLFVEREEAQERYAIPAAYVTYTKYLDIKLGSEKF